ncbi:MAG: InlB B-repeat-containing protein [Clostridia bacterium]|nr:InlB B-repeat-containing protein [Clostridia bacterium]
MSNKRRNILLLLPLVMLIALTLFTVACGKNKVFTVTFDSDGGSSVASQQIKRGEKATKPDDPTKQGYVFVGWYNGNVIYDFNLKVKKDLNLKAKWEEDGLHTSNPDESELQSEESEGVRDSEEGYSDSCEETVSSDESALNFEVTFDTDGSGEIPSQHVLSGEFATDPGEPQKQGFTFLGWYLGEEEFDFSTPITQSLVLTAKWAEVQPSQVCSVTFVTGCDTVIPSQSVLLNGLVEAPPNPEKDGFEFLGWLLNGTEYDFSLPVTESIVLIANWQEIIPDYCTVTFQTNCSQTIESVTVEKGDLVDEPENLIYDGFTFIGWYLDGVAYDFSSQVTEDITLVAVWEEVAYEYYTVHFDTDGGNVIGSQTVIENGFAAEPCPPEKDGYVFICWTCKEEPFDFSTAITQSIILVAKWEILKPIDDFIGEWIGRETVGSGEYLYTVTVSAGGIGCIAISDGYFPYVTEYLISAVYFYSNLFVIEYINNGISMSLYFTIENGLQTDCGIYGGNLHLSKN